MLKKFRILLKKLCIILILILSHLGVAALTFFITTWCWTQQTGNHISNPTEENNNTDWIKKLERFVNDVVAKRENEVISDLLLTLRLYEQLNDVDKLRIIGLKPDKSDLRSLAQLDCIQRFLGSYSDTTKIDPYAFTSKQYQQHFDNLLSNLIRNDNPSREQQVVAARKYIRRLANAFSSMRKTITQIRYTGTDNQLYFWEMLQDISSDKYSDFNFDKYSDLNITVEPVLPLFNDGEGRFILLVENWLNSRYARKALPMEQFNRLYRGDKIRVFSPAYSDYIGRIRAQLDEERKRAEESFGGVSGEELSRAYSDIKSFFVLLAEPSGSAQNGAR